MSGIPRPVDDLPPGAVSVRLVRGALSNNITGHPVELLVDGQPRTVETDEAGRAQFSNLPAGATLKAVAVVDGERLESQEFPVPRRRHPRDARRDRPGEGGRRSAVPRRQPRRAKS